MDPEAENRFRKYVCMPCLARLEPAATSLPHSSLFAQYVRMIYEGDRNGKMTVSYAARHVPRLREKRPAHGEGVQHANAMHAGTDYDDLPINHLGQ